MTEAQKLKIACISMAAAEIELLFKIVGDLGHLGYKVSLYRLYGASYNQCAQKFGISKSLAQFHWYKCIDKGYDSDLRRMFNLSETQKRVQ